MRELGERGREAIAVELPIEDEDAGWERYAEVAAQAVREAGIDRVIAVGHSMGGLVIPLLEGLVELDELVFLCSPLPQPGHTLSDQLEAEPDILVAGSIQSDVQSRGVGEQSDEAARRVYFNDCSEDLVRWALPQLRGQAARPSAEPYPDRAWPPRAACRYILGDDDQIVNPEWSRRAVPQRLGVTPIELPTGHSPFLAAPGALADILVAEN